MILRAIATVVFVLLAQSSLAAPAPTKVTIHIPSKSLSIMPYYFGKDKGFFAAEQIEPQLVMMAPPTAIAALVARRARFFFDHRRGDIGNHARVADSACILRPARPGPCLAGAAGDQSRLKDLIGKTVGVTALTDAVGHVDQRDSARPWHRSRQGHVVGDAGHRQRDQIAYEQANRRDVAGAALRRGTAGKGLRKAG